MFKWFQQTYLNRCKFERPLTHDEWRSINNMDLPQIYPIITRSIIESHNEISKYLNDLCGIRYVYHYPYRDTKSSIISAIKQHNLDELQEILLAAITNYGFDRSYNNPNLAKYLMSIPGLLNHRSKDENTKLYEKLLNEAWKFHGTENEQILYDMIDAKIGINSNEGRGNCGTYYWHSHISRAIENGQVKLVAKLIENGADIHMAHYHDYIITPLIHYAAFAKSNAVEIMQMLLSCDPDIHATDANGDNILDKIINTKEYNEYGHEKSRTINNDLLEFCLSEGVDPKVRNNKGNTLLHKIALNKHVTQETLDILFRYHPNLVQEIEQMHRDDEAQFQAAVDRLHTMKYVVDRNTYFKILEWCREGTVRLISCCPDLDLLEAVYQEYLCTLDELQYPVKQTHKSKEDGIFRFDILELGRSSIRCTVSIKKYDYLSPMQIATKKGNIVVMTALIAHGTNLDECDDGYGWGLLHSAVSSENIDAVRLIYETGKFNINARSKYGTPLDRASKIIEFHDEPDLDQLELTLKMMRVLIAYGANPKYASDDYFSNIFKYLRDLKPYGQKSDTDDEDDEDFESFRLFDFTEEQLDLIQVSSGDNLFSEALEQLGIGEFNLYTLYEVMVQINSLIRHNIEYIKSRDPDCSFLLHTLANRIVFGLDMSDRARFEPPEEHESDASSTSLLGDNNSTSSDSD